MALLDKTQIQGMMSKPNSSTSVGGFVSLLFEIRTNAHIAHLQTQSFAAHKALNELYDEIVDATDAFAEAYQGEYGIITGYNCGAVVEGSDFVSYLQQCLPKINSFRSSLSEGYLQQLIDNILELLYTTLYKLKNLH